MALTTDIIEITEHTLEPGITDIVITSSGGFENALVATYTVPYGIYPSTMYIDSGDLHIKYENHEDTIYVAVLLIRNDLQVINHLESNLEGAALSAKQGKVLKDALDALDIPANITDLDDVVISSIQNGQVLAWDSVLEKFVNVDQSGGSELTYSTTPVKVGTWINGADVMEVVIETGNITVPSGSYANIALSTYGVTDYATVVSFQAYAKTLKRTLPLNLLPTSNYGLMAAVNFDAGTITLNRGNGGDITTDFVFVLRYAKNLPT